MGKTERAVPTVTSPAPARNAENPAIAAAPALPTDPPITSTCPYIPLLESRGRGAISCVMSLNVIRESFSEDWIASSGEPIGAIRVGPKVRFPNTCAGRGAVKVTIASARATAPVCWPKTSESAPEGMSIAITGELTEFIFAIASA